MAGAAGTVTGIRLSTNEIFSTPRGPQAPVTSLSFFSSSGSNDPFDTLKVYAGCWDKSIWQYTFGRATESAAGRTVIDVKNWSAHSDFVKCLLVVHRPNKPPVLVSGGADGTICFWDLEGKKLGFVQPQCRGIECLVTDPLSSDGSPIIFVSTSQREIFYFVLPDFESDTAAKVALSEPILVHDTSVYRLFFDGDGDLWTASADKTAKHLVRDEAWRSDTTLQHPDFVRDVVVHDQYGWVLTACRDEEIRVWNRSTGDLYHVFTGHNEEVTGLAISRNLLISISIDSTMRRWSLEPRALQKAVEEARNPKLLEQEPEPTMDLGLTAEEEAKLEAMMVSEED